MQLLISGLIVAGVLLVTYFLMMRARADKVIADLSHPDRTQEIKEIAKLEQEILDAKIKYNNSRRTLDQSAGRSPDDEGMQR